MQRSLDKKANSYDVNTMLSNKADLNNINTALLSKVNLKQLYLGFYQ